MTVGVFLDHAGNRTVRLQLQRGGALVLDRERGAVQRVRELAVVELADLLGLIVFGIVGAIVGRALYDGRVTVPDAIRVLKGE